MITNDFWYKAVDANVELSYGDIILNCPVVRWTSKPVEVSNQTEIETLRQIQRNSKSNARHFQLHP